MDRIESSVTSVSWIPLEAVEGIQRLSFRMGLGHYDPPPPDEIHDVRSLLAGDKIRFANILKAWIEVDDARVVGYGFAEDSGGHVGRTRIRIAPNGVSLVFAAIPFPLLRPEPESAETSVRFVQTAGGRPGMPLPRHVRRKPFVQISGPTVWTTLSLTIHADGRSEFEMVGASSFPRHWLYDSAGTLASKSGLIDYEKWYFGAFGRHSPWGDENSEAVVSSVESALERELSAQIIDAEPRFRRLATDDVLVAQGEAGDDVFLLFDGILRVERDGEPVAEVGPGAVLGEMAAAEGGVRTATLVAVTACRVAVLPRGHLEQEALDRLSAERRKGASGRSGRTPDPEG
jgi:Cyclic nucleotide-binding domain